MEGYRLAVRRLCLLVILFFPCSQVAQGRSCYAGGSTPFFDIFSQAENVYMAEVKKVGVFPKGRKDFDSVAEVKIVKSWKGPAKGEVKVYFRTFLDACKIQGLKLSEGKEFVFFTKKVDGYDFSSKEIGTRIKGQIEGLNAFIALDFLSKGNITREDFKKFAKEKKVLVTF